MMIQAMIACTCPLSIAPSAPDNPRAEESLSRWREEPNTPSRSNSDVDHAPVSREHALMHRLGKRRMREDALDQLFLSRLQIHGNHETLDQLGNFGADQVGAEKLAALLVEDGLHQALGLAERDRLAVADEGELADADLVAGLLRLFLGKADRGDLRTAIGAARDFQLVERVRLLPGNGLDTDDALVLGLVGKERRPRDVADGVDAGNVGAAEAVDDDGAALDLHAKLLQAEIL